MPTTSSKLPWTDSWFYSPTVDEKQAALNFVETCASFGIPHTKALIDFDGQRTDHQGLLDDSVLPETFQQLQLNFKFHNNQQRRNLQVVISPGRRLLQASTGEVTTEKLELITEALRSCFSRQDEVPLSPARQSQINELFTELESTKASYKTSLAEQISSSEEMRKTQLENLASLKQTYKEHMKLKAPVEYWETREKEYRKISKNRVGWLLGGIMATICALIASTATAAKAYSDTAPPIWILGVVALVASLVVWGLRMLSMAYFSSLHLAEDARFRAEVTTAYLALLSDGAAESSDRHLVLSELFRPVNFGLLKNEGPPLGILDAIRKLNGS